VLVVYPLLYGFPFFLVPQVLKNVNFLQDALHFSWRGLGHLRSCFHYFNLHLAAHIIDTKLEECISYCSTQHFPSSSCATFKLNCSLKWILLCKMLTAHVISPQLLVNGYHTGKDKVTPVHTKKAYLHSFLTLTLDGSTPDGIRTPDCPACKLVTLLTASA
jgi:hypothetical protein